MTITYEKHGNRAYSKGDELKDLISELKRCDWWFPIVNKREIKRKLQDGKNRGLCALWDRAKKEDVKIEQVALIGAWRRDTNADEYYIVSKEDVEYLAEILEINMDPMRMSAEQRVKGMNDVGGDRIDQGFKAV